MERALDISILSAALAGRSGLPTAAELQGLMAEVEIQIVMQRPEISQQLIDTAWYLHAVASVSGARERYTLARQRQAFQVSAHIFDLALITPDPSPARRLSLGFAAAIGYRRGGLDPNATAIFNRLRVDIQTDVDALEHLPTFALEVGVAFVGFETRALFRWLRVWRQQLAILAQESGLDDLSSTAYGPTQYVVVGADELLQYFARGSIESLQRARLFLRTAAIGNAGPEDVNARWVAAHLLGIAEDGPGGSLWNPDIFPPDVSDLVRQSFTLGRSPVLTLWEPQRELLNKQPSPFAPSVRRLVLAVPTSGGKTLIAQMLAVEHLSGSESGICYVAPTRSLGREVRRAMSSRVQILQKEAAPELPDFPSIDSFFRDQDLGSAEIEVMTPERLLHHLRHDATAVLDRFGVFIFDEAQFMKETGRGFVLEATISLLNYLTEDLPHRMILISAAMGNSGTVAHWLDPSGNALQHRSDWRGPRRLHAVFTTRANWNSSTIERAAKAKKWFYRRSTPLTGLIRLRMSSNRVHRLTLTPDSAWTLVFKGVNQDFIGEVEKDSSLSTRQYLMAAEMITELGHAGSILVVANEREDSQRLAMGIADRLPPAEGTANLVEFAVTQLGGDHPLISVLRRGVGFHHAGLPIEVLEALEDAVRDDSLKYLACTSTLTDGVNLPVRTVVIYDKTYEGQPQDIRLEGARLVNAIGRAGRAGRETEGWIVLARTASPSDADFDQLSPNDDDLEVLSNLVNDEALAALAEFENQARSNEDAIFEVANSMASSFLSYVWLVLSIEEARGVDPATISSAEIIDSTLGSRQSESVRSVCTSAGDAAKRAYIATDSSSRRRWTRSGTSIGSARLLDRIASGLALRITAEYGATPPKHPVEALDILAQPIEQILSLTERPPFVFRRSSRGAEIAVDILSVLADWIRGASFPEMAESHLREASKPSWRAEQIVDAVTKLFEHFLAWTVGALVELTNMHLEGLGIASSFCPDLGQFIRYGVADSNALVLMKAGIRSRRLAIAITDSLPTNEYTLPELRDVVSSMSIDYWRSQFVATRSEVTDLLEFSRPRYRSHLRSFLETGSAAVKVRLHTDLDALIDAPLSLAYAPDEPEPAALAVFVDETRVATVEVSEYADASALIDTGLEFAISVGRNVTGDPILTISAYNEAMSSASGASPN